MLVCVQIIFSPNIYGKCSILVPTIISKPIPWESLTLSNEWNFKQLLALKLVEQPKLLSIVEDGQGNVQINFEQRKEPSRRSYSTNYVLEIRTPSRSSYVQSNFRLILEELALSSTIQM